MKRNKMLAVFLLVLSIMCCAFITASCSCSGGEDDLIMAPEIIVTEDGIAWTSVENAKGYKYRFGQNEWTDANNANKVSFPNTEGDYKLEVIAVADGDYSDSESAVFEFKVSKLTAVQAIIKGNTVEFSDENALYSVNGGEYSKVNSGNQVNFSNLSVGSSVEVKCYLKGGYYDTSLNTYYIDSDTSSVSLLVKDMLATPQIEWDSVNNGVKWNAVPNATNYEVTINEKTSTVSTTFVRIDTSTAGTVNVSVLAKSQSDIYTDSDTSSFSLSVLAKGNPELTVEDDTIYVDNSLANYFEYSDNGAEYLAVGANNMANATNRKFRIASHFDSVNKVFYPTTRQASFVKRANVEITVSQTGTISWNADDAGLALSYSYKCYQDTAPSEYFETANNSYDVSSLTAGEYTFKIFGNSYQQESGDEVTYYFNSQETSETFTVLETPNVKNGYQKFSVDSIANASGYRYKQGDNGTWQSFSDSEREIAVSQMGYYYVQALGDGENNVIDSKIVKKYLEPSLKTQSGVRELANFNDTAYMDRLEIPTVSNASTTGAYEIIDGANAPTGANGKVLKLTAGNAKPRNTNEPGNCDGITFNLVEPLVLENVNYVTFRIYIKSSSTITSGALIFSVRGVSKLDGKTVQNATWTDTSPLEMDTWVEYKLNLEKYRDGQKKYGTDEWAFIPMFSVTDFSVLWCDIGAEGDTFYVDSITTPVAPVAMTEYQSPVPQAHVQNGFQSAKLIPNNTQETISLVDQTSADFNTAADYSTMYVEGGTDNYVARAYLKGNSNTATYKFDTSDAKFVASRKFVVRLKYVSDFTASPYPNVKVFVNGSYKTYIDGAKYYDTWTEITINTTEELQTLSFVFGNTSHNCELFIDYVLYETEQNFTGDSLTFADANNAKYLSYSGSMESKSVVNGVLNMQLTGNSNLIKVNFDGRELTDATITIVADFGAATNSNGGVYVNGSANTDWKKNFVNQDGEQTITFTFTGTLNTLIIKNYNNSDTRTIKISSITIS